MSDPSDRPNKQTFSDNKTTILGLIGRTLMFSHKLKRTRLTSQSSEQVFLNEQKNAQSSKKKIEC